ncbi:MAG: FAD-binding oxidoreductase [Burkholderiaceae bacterium]|jgi:gamma-glutamylputrescine oxidase|nr:FAD-binding oxidoreductase [Burkholderiaceae bacterium]
MKLNKPTFLDHAPIADTKLNSDANTWNWRRNHAFEGQAPANFYEASLSAWPAFPQQQNDISCDVLVVGAGLLGSSAALHLAEAGVDVVLIDKGSVGAGASGRNGGQLTPGLARWEASDMLANLPVDEAHRLWRFASIESMELIDQIAERYGLDLDLKRGHITAAVHPGHMSALLAGTDARRRLGDASASVVGQFELSAYIRSDIYYGGIIDRTGGQLHPLALLRGLIYAFIQQGGGVHENSEALDMEKHSDRIVVRTSRGTITARKGAILAVHHSTFNFLSSVTSTTVPFFTYVGVTAPLSEDIGEFLPADMPVYDTQYQIDYYRAVRGNRLLFGGQGTGTSWSPERINDYFVDRIKTVFPQMTDPELEFSWSGISDLTLNGATDCRKAGDQTPVYMAHGWSGHGVAQTVRIGKAISDDLLGHHDDFAMLTQIAHIEIPLGRQLSPVAIPIVKAAFGAIGTVNPGRLISF